MIREYRIYNGNFEGTHLIFDNSIELLEKYPNAKLWMWRDGQLDSYQVGDWMKAEDGFYIQILHIRNMLRKKDKMNINTFIRFPVGTFCVYRKRDNTFTYPKLLASISKLDSGSISGQYRNLDRDAMLKIKFASYILAGVEPGKAYLMAYQPIQRLTPYQFNKKALTLMSDEIVKNEVKNQLETFINKVDEKFPIERIITALDDLLTCSRKGTKNHRENIELIMELKGLKQRSPALVKEKAKIQEASYEEIPSHMKDDSEIS